MRLVKLKTFKNKSGVVFTSNDKLRLFHKTIASRLSKPLWLLQLLLLRSKVQSLALEYLVTTKDGTIKISAHYPIILNLKFRLNRNAYDYSFKCKHWHINISFQSIIYKKENQKYHIRYFYFVLECRSNLISHEIKYLFAL